MTASEHIIHQTDWYKAMVTAIAEYREFWCVSSHRPYRCFR